MRKRRQHPIQKAPIGSVWMLDVGFNGLYVWYAVVIGEKNVRVGNYPLLMLDNGGKGTTQPGQRFNAAVTTARYWRRFA